MLRISALVVALFSAVAVIVGLMAAPQPLAATAAVVVPPLPTTWPTPASPAPTATPIPLPLTAPTAVPVSVAGVTAGVPPVLELDPPELRAVWVDAFHDGFKTPDQVDELLAWARSAHLNALFVQVRRRGDAYFLKSLEPRAEDPDFAPAFDALQYLLDRAHQGPQRLQVHAWMATLPIWHQRDTPPTTPSHPFNLRGTTANATDTWVMYRDDGVAWAGQGSAGMYYLDPGNLEVQNYTTEVYLHLLRNYDVDGIHLDQIRYFEGDPLRWGYNPSSVARFNERYARETGSQPAPTDRQWVAWRREQVTSLVRRIYLEAKALKPSVAVTAAVVTWGKGPQTADDWERQPAYASVLQDWRFWLQEGIVDYLLPMDYYRETLEQGAWFDTWTQWQVSNPGTRGVVLGVGSYLNTAEGALAQLSRARALGGLGVALYSYAVPTRDLEFATREERQTFAARLRAVFARPAPVPELPSTVAAAGT